MQTKRVKVDLQNLMLQAAQEMKCMGVSMGFMLANTCLQNIAKRAAELDDKALLEELDTIGYIATEKGAK